MRAIAWRGPRVRELESWQQVSCVRPVWVDLARPEEAELSAVRRVFAMPPLLLQEHAGQRHRALLREGPQGMVALTLPLGALDADTDVLEVVWGEDFLLSVHRKPAPCVAAAARRLAREAQGRAGAAFSLYLLLDEAVEAAFPELDQLQETIFQLEGELASRPGREFLTRLFHTRRHVLQLRRVLAGQRQVLSRLLSDAYRHRLAELHPYMEDVHDHLSLALETLDSFHEVLSSTVESYMSSASNRLNQIMKTLTILATVMMPLTLITGIYGMNFRIPEVRWAYGYYYSLGLMAAVTLMMLLYFRSRRWI
ncbi:MAG: magnesium/cobalt transporter CorA [Thermaerobacter sp.]|nr:magnesium/cobalt transporter CorA [Thermaerobacter sp.]